MIDLIVAPVRFFTDRLSEPCRGLAITAVGFYAVLVACLAVVTSASTTQLVVALSGDPVTVAVVSALSGVVLFLLMFALQVFVLFCFYWISGSTGASSKLVEFASIASFVRVPGIVAVIIVMYFVDPIQVPEGASPVELQALVVEYQSVVASTRPVLVVQAIDLLVGLCASALNGVALFVVSGCSVTRAVAAATVSGMFHVVPWVSGLLLQ